MSTAVIGATGRVGSEIVRGVLARGEDVLAVAHAGDQLAGFRGRRRVQAVNLRAIIALMTRRLAQPAA